jgi:ketopantoate reductase
VRILPRTAALTAAARLPIGPAWAQPAFRGTYERAMAEVEALASHAGIPVAAVVRRGRDAGIPTPVMATLYGILKPFEHGAPGAASGA